LVGAVVGVYGVGTRAVTAVEVASSVVAVCIAEVVTKPVILTFWSAKRRWHRAFRRIAVTPLSENVNIFAVGRNEASWDRVFSIGICVGIVKRARIVCLATNSERKHAGRCDAAGVGNCCAYVRLFLQDPRVQAAEKGSPCGLC
jgi:hypothetical protein